MKRSLTIKAGQAHVPRSMRPLPDRIQNGEIDPAFVITPPLLLGQAAYGYETLANNQDGCVKVVLKP